MENLLIYLLLFIIFIIAIIEAFVIANLLKKVEIYEDDIEYKNQFFDKLKLLVEESSDKMKTMDSLGLYESDDETGFFFRNIKNISVTLSGYFLKYKK